MTQASLRDIIEQERAAGKLDTATLTLLRRSKLKPPEGFYCWSLPALRSVMGEDASGFDSTGHQGGGFTVSGHSQGGAR